MRLLLISIVVLSSTWRIGAQVEESEFVGPWQLRAALMQELKRPILWDEDFVKHEGADFKVVGLSKSALVRAKVLAEELILGTPWLLLRRGLASDGPLTLFPGNSRSDMHPLIGRLVSSDQVLSDSIPAAEFVHCVLALNQLDSDDMETLVRLRRGARTLEVFAVPQANALIIAGQVAALKPILLLISSLEERAAQSPEAIPLKSKNPEIKLIKYALVQGQEPDAVWCLDMKTPFSDCIIWSHFHFVARFSPRAIAKEAVDWAKAEPMIAPDAARGSFSVLMQERSLANNYVCIPCKNEDAVAGDMELRLGRVVGSLEDQARPFDPKDLLFAVANPAVVMSRKIGYGRLSRDRSEALMGFLIGDIGFGETKERNAWTFTASAVVQARLHEVLSIVDALTEREAVKARIERTNTK